jgi:polar amino acid transport system substrate-binding protein
MHGRIARPKTPAEKRSAPRGRRHCGRRPDEAPQRSARRRIGKKKREPGENMKKSFARAAWPTLLIALAALGGAHLIATLPAEDLAGRACAAAPETRENPAPADGAGDPAHAAEITLATGEWAPYTSRKLDGYGTFSRKVTAVIREMGMKPVYDFYPWRRCYQSVIKGRIWGAFPYSRTQQREQEVWYSDPLSYSKSLFFYYQKEGEDKSFEYSDLSELNKWRVGGVRGYFYEEWLKEAGVAVDYANSEVAAMEKLRRGRIDLMPMNEQVGWTIVRRHFPDEAANFKTVSRPLSVDPLHVIVSKTHPGSRELLHRFNAALARCRDRGSIPPLPGPYGGPEAGRKADWQ